MPDCAAAYEKGGHGAQDMKDGRATASAPCERARAEAAAICVRASRRPHGRR